MTSGERITISTAFTGLLGGTGSFVPEADAAAPPEFASDLNLDQIVSGVIQGRDEPDFLAALLYQGLRDAEAVRFRQEVFADLEGAELLEGATRFSEQMRVVRRHLTQLEKMQSRYQREGWYLDAAAIYCAAVRSLSELLESADLRSAGLVAFREFLRGYVASPAFTSLNADTERCQGALAGLRYCVRIRGGRVDVSRYEGEPDYSAEVLDTFDRFKQGAVKDYRVRYRTWPGMDHVGAQILELVARLFSAEFAALDEYCAGHAQFLDETVHIFDRELQFYIAYLDYTAPLLAAGLPFCHPEVDSASKEVFAAGTFDLALAQKLVKEGQPLVLNEFSLMGDERVLVVSGPNQGGKTTFARAFGQLHHLASVGCPVPGRSARLFLCDGLFTHFEREEDLGRQSGKLEDDLVRIQNVLRRATGDSIVIMNEIFTSTTLNDARFLGQKVLERVIQLDLICVYVTFIDELASLGNSVVSMVSTIVPENPAERTFRVVRAPADGLAYALAIAEKYDLTYERLRQRIDR